MAAELMAIEKKAIQIIPSEQLSNLGLHSYEPECAIVGAPHPIRLEDVPSDLESRPREIVKGERNHGDGVPHHQTSPIKGTCQLCPEAGYDLRGEIPDVHVKTARLGSHG